MTPAKYEPWKPALDLYILCKHEHRLAMKIRRVVLCYDEEQRHRTGSEARPRRHRWPQRGVGAVIRGTHLTSKHPRVEDPRRQHRSDETCGSVTKLRRGNARRNVRGTCGMTHHHDSLGVATEGINRFRQVRDCRRHVFSTRGIAELWRKAIVDRHPDEVVLDSKAPNVVMKRAAGSPFVACNKSSAVDEDEYREWRVWILRWEM